VARVEITCPAGATVVEALVSTSQQSAWGIGPIRDVACDGALYTYEARVTRGGEAAFHPGRMDASAYVLICSADECPSKSANGDIVGTPLT
jgi:hypothetical protein